MKLKKPIAQLKRNEQTLVAPKRTPKKKFSDSEKQKIRNAYIVGEFAADRGAIKAPAKDKAFLEIFKDELNVPQGENHEIIMALMESWHSGYTNYILNGRIDVPNNDKPLNSISAVKRKKSTILKNRTTNGKKNNRHNDKATGKTGWLFG